MAGSVIINFDGNAQGVRSAANMASDAMNFFNGTLKNAADAARIFSNSFNTTQLQAYADTMTLARNTVTTLTDAQKVLGDSFMLNAQAFLDGATSAQDYADRLEVVQAQVTAAKAAIDQTTGNGNSGIKGLTAALTDGWSAIGDWISQSTSFVSSLMAWSVIQQVISWVQQLSQSLFDLNVQTEKSVMGWSYLFGGTKGPSPQNARSLANWSYQFSMQIPFTRQQLMSGITTLGAAGMNPQQLEQFMPFLSDIAATYGSAAYGGQGTSIDRAAQAVRMAHEGMSRMLKYDLNISPEELIPYGLQATGTGTGLHITDKNSLYRALEKFAIAHHLSNVNAQGQYTGGASEQMTGSTWWGGFSSATDQLQNFLLQVGGTSATGEIRKGSFFATLKDDLFRLMDWFTSNQNGILKFADVLSRLVGTVVDAGGGLLGNFFEWLGKLGTVSDVLNIMTGLTTTLQTTLLGTPDVNVAGVVIPADIHVTYSGAPETVFGPNGHREVVYHPNRTIHPALRNAPLQPGGAGGRTAPSGSQPPHVQKGHKATGIDWENMAVIGGILQGFQSVDWSPIVNGWKQLASGWTTFVNAWNDSGAGQVVINILMGLFKALLWAVDLGVFVPLEGLLTGLGQTFKWFATALEGAKPALHWLAGAIDWFNTTYQTLDQNILKFINRLGDLYNLLTAGNWQQALSVLATLFGFGAGGNTGGGGGNHTSNTAAPHGPLPSAPPGSYFEHRHG